MPQGKQAYPAYFKTDRHLKKEVETHLVEYLGIIFDRSLLYKYHVDKHINNCKSGIAALKTMVSTNMK